MKRPDTNHKLLWKDRRQITYSFNYKGNPVDICVDSTSGSLMSSRSTFDEETNYISKDTINNIKKETNQLQKQDTAAIKNCCAHFFAPALRYCYSFATELSPKVFSKQGFTEVELVFNGLYFNVSRWIFVSCWAHSNCLLIDVDLRTLICVKHTIFTPQAAFAKLLIPWTQNIKILRQCVSMCQELVSMNSFFCPDFIWFKKYVLGTQGWSLVVKMDAFKCKSVADGWENTHLPFNIDQSDQEALHWHINGQKSSSHCFQLLFRMHFLGVMAMGSLVLSHSAIAESDLCRP